MADRQVDVDPEYLGGEQYRAALKCIKQALVDGLRHGYSKCAIECRIGNNNRRELVIETSKSYKFNIPEDEMPD